MLSDNEASSLAKDVAAFRYIVGNHAAAVQALTANHEKLIADYKVLLNEYEETKDARDRYKRQARGNDGRPFILALIDGDANIFDEQLVGQSPNGDGGRVAADMLLNFMLERVRRLGLPHDTQCVVRYFVNVAGASTELFRLHALGSHCRALAPFAAAFSRRQALFDVVDTGEKPGAVDNKIADNFRLFIDNPHCKHILFGACNTPAHLSLLAPYERQVERITLLRNSQSLIQYSTLGLRADELAGIFRDGRLPVVEPTSRRKALAEASAQQQPAKPGTSQHTLRQQSPSKPNSSPDGTARGEKHRPADRDGLSKSNGAQPTNPWLQPISASQLPPSADAEPLAKVPDNSKALPWPSKDTHKQPLPCMHFQKGYCKFGTHCNRRHESPPSNDGHGISVPVSTPEPATNTSLLTSASTPTISRAAASEDWRRPADAGRARPIWDYRVSEHYASSPSTTPSHEHTAVPIDQTTKAGYTMKRTASVASLWDPTQGPPTNTPRRSERTHSTLTKIPINAAGHRLDLFPGPLNPDDETALAELRMLAPPCVSLHLLGTCGDSKNCRFDHGFIPEKYKVVLRHQLHRRPCPNSVKCRDQACLMGHVCWEAACQVENSPHCRLPRAAHGVDPVAVKWVAGGEGQEEEQKPEKLVDIGVDTIDLTTPALTEGTENSSISLYTDSGMSQSDGEDLLTPRASQFNTLNTDEAPPQLPPQALAQNDISTDPLFSYATAIEMKEGRAGLSDTEVQFGLLDQPTPLALSTTHEETHRGFPYEVMPQTQVELPAVPNTLNTPLFDSGHAAARNLSPMAAAFIPTNDSQRSPPLNVPHQDGGSLKKSEDEKIETASGDIGLPVRTDDIAMPEQPDGEEQGTQEDHGLAAW